MQTPSSCTPARSECSTPERSLGPASGRSEPSEPFLPFSEQLGAGLEGVSVRLSVETAVDQQAKLGDVLPQLVGFVHVRGMHDWTVDKQIDESINPPGASAASQQSGFLPPNAPGASAWRVTSTISPPTFA
jgi:hypothetical protein